MHTSSRTSGIINNQLVSRSSSLHVKRPDWIWVLLIFALDFQVFLLPDISLYITPIFLDLRVFIGLPFSGSLRICSKSHKSICCSRLSCRCHIIMDPQYSQDLFSLFSFMCLCLCAEKYVLVSTYLNRGHNPLEVELQVHVTYLMW